MRGWQIAWHMHQRHVKPELKQQGGTKAARGGSGKKSEQYSSLLVHTKGHSSASCLSPIHQDGCFGEKTHLTSVLKSHILSPF